MENLVGLPLASFWAGKRVLLTGHTGFKGSWLALWLHELGAEVCGIGLAPDTRPSLFELLGLERVMESHLCDIRDRDAVARIAVAARPDLVFHLAAQPLVRRSYREPVETFASNVMGTVHLLEAVRSTPSVRTVVMVTTDKVYRNEGLGRAFVETDTLGGHDPYSASKAACEIVIDSYRRSYLEAAGAAVSSARSGNIIGGGDWCEDRIIPDAVRAWTAGAVLQVRRPSATRPWQHVLDGVHAYLHLAAATWARPELAGAYNFGPDPSQEAPVKEVIERCRTRFGAGDVSYASHTEGPHESERLSLNVENAWQRLGFAPTWNLDATVDRTMGWYRGWREGRSANELCLDDLRAYGAR